MQEYTVTADPVSHKTGTGPKGSWTIWKIEVDGYDSGKSWITGFDKVAQGDKVTIEEVQNGNYTNHNYKKVKTDGEKVQTTSGQPNASDARLLKLMVLMAQQMGIDKNEILEIIGNE